MNDARGMRILHVISGIDPQNGGPTNALIGLTKAQAALGLQITVVSTWRYRTGLDNASSFEENGVRVRMIGPAWGPLSWHASIPSVLRELVTGADVVHIHALFESIQHRAAMFARRQRVPYLFRPCNGLTPWSLSRSSWRKRLYLALRLRRDLDSAAAIHYTTGKERSLTAPLQLRAPVIVEPNGVDLEEFRSMPAPGRFRARYPKLAGRRLLLFLGRIAAEKGLDLLVPAFAGLAERGWALVLAGPDHRGYLPVVQQHIRSRGLDHAVHHVGALSRSERLEALADADLCVLPSYTENFGIAAVEAMAAGVAVVVSEGVGLAPDIAAARAGGVASLTRESLAQELLEWTDDQRRRAAGARAREFALTTYDWRTIAARWHDHYRNLLLRAAPARPAEAIP